MIIAFAGRMRTGKTSHARAVADYCEFQGYWGEKPPVHSFAGAIREGAARDCGFPLELSLTQEGKETKIHNRMTDRTETVREAIIDWVTKKREEDPLAFVRIMREKIDAWVLDLYKGDIASPFIIDDVRMPEEVAMLASCPAACIFKCLPGADWKPDANANHPTETSLDDFTGWPDQNAMKKMVDGQGLADPAARMCLHLPKIRSDGSFRPLDDNVENILFVARCAFRSFLDIPYTQPMHRPGDLWREYGRRALIMRQECPPLSEPVFPPAENPVPTAQEKKHGEMYCGL